MRPTSANLLNVFTRLDNCRARGFLSTAPKPAGGAMPIRLLHVLKPCFLVEGNVLKTESGGMILLMEAPQNQDIYKTFQAVLISNTYPWSRKSQVPDPVSKVMRDDVKVDLGLVYAYFDRPTDVKLDNMVETSYQFYTGQLVQVGDLVGGKLVSKVTKIAGVYLVLAE